MGFRQGAFARVWSVNDEGKYSTVNLSISRKNKETGNYDIEFTDGYVRFIGTAHESIKELDLPTRDEFDAKIHKGATIKISSCDVNTHYDSKTKKSYTNYLVFGFEIPEDNFSGNNKQSGNAKGGKSATKGKLKTKASPKVEDNEEEDEDYPF